MSVFLRQTNGTLVKKTSFKTAVMASDAVGKTVIIAGDARIIDHITIPVGVATRVENGAFFSGPGSIDFNNQPFESFGQNVFRNSGSIIGLKTDSPDVISKAVRTSPIREIPIVASAETGHVSTFSHTNAYGNERFFSADGNHGWLDDPGARPIFGAITFSMPFGVIIGDSISEGWPGGTSRLHPAWDENKVNTAGQMSYHIEQLTRMKVYNHGYASQTSQEVRDRWHRDVLAQTDGGLSPTNTLPRKPAFVVMVVGINDVFTDVSTDITIANIEWMVNSAVSNNIIPVIFTIGPHTEMTAARLAAVKKINNYLAYKNSTTALMALVDFYGYANDPNNDGKPKTGLFIDDVHPLKNTYRDLSHKIVDEAFRQLIPRFINLESYMDLSVGSQSIHRPTGVILYINGIPRKVVLLPNLPIQQIRIPDSPTVISTIKLEIISRAAPVEEPASTGANGYGWARITVTDRSKELEDGYFRTGENDESEITEFPSINDIARGRAAVPDGVTPGDITYATTPNNTSISGVFLTTTADSKAFVVTKGLGLVSVDSPTKKGDYLVSVENAANFTRSVAPVAGTAKVIAVTDSINGFCIGRIV